MASYNTSIRRCNASGLAITSGKPYGPKRLRYFLNQAEHTKSAADCRIGRWSRALGEAVDRGTARSTKRKKKAGSTKNTRRKLSVVRRPKRTKRVARRRSSARIALT